MLKFFITDVFGFEKYTGNQLATFFNCEGLSDAEMQQIAREINFSETTFITNVIPNNGMYNVRIFTPNAEVDFAGHPTLGTAYIINKYLATNKLEQVVLNLKVGAIPVKFENGLLWMQQVQPQFGKQFPPDLIANILGISVNDIDSCAPAEEVSTGLPFTIVPLKNRKALQKAAINAAKYASFLQLAWAKGILIFCPDGYTKEQALSVRVFVPHLGIPEDPATGSANGCLAAWLLKHCYMGKRPLDIKVGQGYEIKRPSQVCIKAEKVDKNYFINVGGRAIEVAQGAWGS